jgi:hypothetical protein
MLWLAIVIGVVLGFISLLLPRSDKLLNSNNMDQNIGLLQEGHFIAAGLGFLLPMAFFAVIAFFVLSVIHMVFSKARTGTQQTALRPANCWRSASVSKPVPHCVPRLSRWRKDFWACRKPDSSSVFSSTDLAASAARAKPPRDCRVLLAETQQRVEGERRCRRNGDEQGRYDNDVFHLRLSSWMPRPFV